MTSGKIFFISLRMFNKFVTPVITPINIPIETDPVMNPPIKPAPTEDPIPETTVLPILFSLPSPPNAASPKVPPNNGAIIDPTNARFCILPILSCCILFNKIGSTVSKILLALPLPFPNTRFDDSVRSSIPGRLINSVPV